MFSTTFSLGKSEKRPEKSFVEVSNILMYDYDDILLYARFAKLRWMWNIIHSSTFEWENIKWRKLKCSWQNYLVGKLKLKFSSNLQHNNEWNTQEQPNDFLEGYFVQRSLRVVRHFRESENVPCLFTSSSNQVRHNWFETFQFFFCC